MEQWNVRLWGGAHPLNGGKGETIVHKGHRTMEEGHAVASDDCP